MARGASISTGPRLARRSALSRRLAPMCLVSLLVLIVGWSALWLYARHEAARQFKVWREAERAQGREWTCGTQAIGGFPLDIELRCGQPRFKGAIADGVYTGQAEGFTATAPLYFPTRVVVDVASPVTIQDVKGGQPTRIAWNKAELTLRGEVPGDLDRGQLDAEGIVATLPGLDPAQPVRIGRLETSIKPITPTAGHPFDAETTLVVDGAQVPAADAAFGTSEPIAASLNAVVTRVQATGPTLQELVEPWREAGGQIRLKSFGFSKGPFRAAGDGRIELDEERRLDGRLETHFSGIGPVFQRFGIPTGAVKLGGLLSSFLGGKSAQPDAGQPDLTLPLVAKDGRLWVGPIKTGISFTPLY